MRILSLVACFVLSTSTEVIQGAERPAAKNRPIQALLVTGGCCHDYDRQKLILTRGISARANVRWTVVQQGGRTTNTAIPMYNDPDWAEGFDIVVHNECFSDVKDLEFVDRILQPHRDGTPAILIHCAMHCYRTGDNRWFEFVGLKSPGHGPHYSYTADNLQPQHPIMKGFGQRFVAPKGELYHAVEVFKTATPLAQANRQADGKPQVCVWTNDYHGTRVFGTTIGHYNETMVQPGYLDMLTRGLLWAVGRDPEAEFTATTQKVDEQIKQLATASLEPVADEVLGLACCGEGNLAPGAKTAASSEETAKNNYSKNANDGDLTTRWCASGGAAGEWLQLKFEQPRHIRSLRLHWEKKDTAYRYRIDVSPNGKKWKTIVDASQNNKAAQITPHVVDAPNTLRLKVTFLGATPSYWGSLWEFEAYESQELPELPDRVVKAGDQERGSSNLADLDVADGFEVRIFGAPPEVNYPVCLTAAATGEVFVGVDEQGSLGKEPGRGKVLRCIDTDGDGMADQINEFARMDHPRGLIYDQGSLWVLHPPFLSVYRDTDGDGTADNSEVLVTGISTDEVNKRGADHTTNGIRRGIDGWIYIAVGDFGMHHAVAQDGSTLSRRGGGVVRVRPDGSNLEIYSWGQRNIVDVAIDPLMNVYTRDNTNDGGGWDIRLSHIIQTAHYGYPSLYKNFTAETMPPLADYGGGSGCGAMFFQDARWPAGFQSFLLTCDWGRSEVYSHNLPPNGATFDAQQDTFLKLPRPTDIDADGSGRMYVSSWRNGKFNYGGPNVGYVAQIIPAGFVPKPVVPLTPLDAIEVVEHLRSPSASMREFAQQELLRRKPVSAEVEDRLIQLMTDAAQPINTRVTALYTLKQLTGSDSHSALVKLAADPTMREHCLRALTDRRQQLQGVPSDLYLESLPHPDARIQSAAIIGLARLIQSSPSRSAEDELRKAAAEALIPLTQRRTAQTESEGDSWRQPDPGRVIPHLAVKALVDIEAIPTCLAALEGPDRDGVLWALKSMHSPDTVNGLFRVLSSSRDPRLRSEIWTTLIRLYHREGEFTADSPGWWGTRPDTTGPYYHRQKWSETDRIAAALQVALAEGDPRLTAHIKQQLSRHVVKLDGVDDDDLAALQEPQEAIKLPSIDPDNPEQIHNLPSEEVLARAMKASGDAAAGQKLFRAQSCANCHTYANGQKPKGPHLVDIGKRYKKAELVESIVDPSKKIAQGFDTWVFAMDSGKLHTGFVVLESAETVTIRLTNGLSEELLQDEIDERVKQPISMMPKEIAANLTPEQLADLIAYLQTLH